MMMMMMMMMVMVLMMVVMLMMTATMTWQPHPLPEKTFPRISPLRSIHALPETTLPSNFGNSLSLVITMFMMLLVMMMLTSRSSGCENFISEVGCRVFLRLGFKRGLMAWCLGWGFRLWPRGLGFKLYSAVWGLWFISSGQNDTCGSCLGFVYM